MDGVSDQSCDPKLLGPGQQVCVDGHLYNKLAEDDVDAPGIFNAAYWTESWLWKKAANAMGKAEVVEDNNQETCPEECPDNCVKNEEDVVVYNEAAVGVAHERCLLVDDLNRVVVEAGVAECLQEDDVHMTPKGNNTLAPVIAESLRAALRDLDPAD